MRARVRRRIRRRAAPKVHRCACAAGAREAATERAGALMIGGARDPAEARAEARAAQALGPARRVCADCAEDEARRRPAAGVLAPGAAPAPAPKAAEAAVGRLGPGAPLSGAERAFYEPRLGADLSAVRLHDGPAADRAATTMDAAAFTLGRDVAFARGARARGGAPLFAHELAHAAEGAPTVRRVVRSNSRCQATPDRPGNALAVLLRADQRAFDMAQMAAWRLRVAAINPHARDFFFRPAVIGLMQLFRPPRASDGVYTPRLGGTPMRGFRDTVAAEMIYLAGRFQAIAQHLQGQIRYLCYNDRELFRMPGCGSGYQGCEDGTFWSCPGGPSNIAVCDGAWAESSMGADLDHFAAGVVHEVMHIVLRGRSHALSRQGRFRNAACYDNMVMHLVGRADLHHDCPNDLTGMMLVDQATTAANAADAARDARAP